MNSLVKNAADPGQVREATRREKDDRKKELEDIKAVMDFKPGARFIWRLLHDLCHINAMSAVTTNTPLTFMNEGKREIGRVVMADVFEVALMPYQHMEREYLASVLLPEEKGT